MPLVRAVPRGRAAVQRWLRIAGPLSPGRGRRFRRHLGVEAGRTAQETPTGGINPGRSVRAAEPLAGSQTTPRGSASGTRRAARCRVARAGSRFSARLVERRFEGRPGGVGSHGVREAPLEARQGSRRAPGRCCAPCGPRGPSARQALVDVPREAASRRADAALRCHGEPRPGPPGGLGEGARPPSRP